jgi:hypothetical protein
MRLNRRLSSLQLDGAITAGGFVIHQQRSENYSKDNGQHPYITKRSGCAVFVIPFSHPRQNERDRKVTCASHDRQQQGAAARKSLRSYAQHGGPEKRLSYAKNRGRDKGLLPGVHRSQTKQPHRGDLNARPPAPRSCGTQQSGDCARNISTVLVYDPVTSFTRLKKARLRSVLMPQFTGTV